VVFDNKLWVLGGLYLESGHGGAVIDFYLNDEWSSPDGSNWTRTPPYWPGLKTSEPWGERAYHTSAVFNNQIWVLDGDEQWPEYGIRYDAWAMSVLTVTIATGHAPWYEVGTPMDLRAVMSGISPEGISCQWSKDGSAIPGATEASYRIDQVQASDAGLYGFQVTDQYGATFTADPVPITVVAGPIPTAGPAALALAVVAIGLWALVVLRSHGRFTQAPR
jgi:ABC-type Fe3+-hydroxamate transport system substrate-binding protein